MLFDIHHFIDSMYDLHAQLLLFLLPVFNYADVSDQAHHTKCLYIGVFLSVCHLFPQKCFPTSNMKALLKASAL